jgi:predicted AAA+ superfamily ATPase
MRFSREHFARELLDELETEHLLLVTGPRGSGKTTLLEELSSRWGGPSAIIQLEAVGCSPEILAKELPRLSSGIVPALRGTVPSPFEGLLDALARQKGDTLLLLDDVTELRTLAAYPDVDDPLNRLIDGLRRSRGRALLTSRFPYWTKRNLVDVTIREIPPLSTEEIETAGVAFAASVQSITGGLAVHADRLAETLENVPDLLGALRYEMSSGGRIEAECRAGYKELLHRARGYGACKMVLRVLANEQGLNLTEVARRLVRTAGSTRDYLRWLEEVELIHAVEKRFSFVDPLLRLWFRIYEGGVIPDEARVADEVSRYLSLMVPEDIVEEAEGFTLPPRRPEDLVEID